MATCSDLPVGHEPRNSSRPLCSRNETLKKHGCLSALGRLRTYENRPSFLHSSRMPPLNLERSVAEVLRLLLGLLPECDPQHRRRAKPGGEGASGMVGPTRTARRAWPTAAICFQAAGRGPPPIQSAPPAAMPRHCRRGTGSTSGRGRAGMLHRWQQSPLPAPGCSPCERCR
jgi:hypothetical protein